MHGSRPRLPIFIMALLSSSLTRLVVSINGGVTSPYVTLYSAVRCGDLTAPLVVAEVSLETSKQGITVRVRACPDRITRSIARSYYIDTATIIGYNREAICSRGPLWSPDSYI
jgi:hypothetical protein